LSAVLGFIKKSRNLKHLSLFTFFVFLALASWTGYRLVNKSYNKVANMLKPRTGDEIYDALFDRRKTNCVKVLNYQDQVVPKIDYAIWLHFKTCPEELKRILSRHEFSGEKVEIKSSFSTIPNEEQLDWFNPATMGDTILVYEYSTSNSRNIQSIWASLDSTEVFCRDILD
jgi:hypothetical protein